MCERCFNNRRPDDEQFEAAGRDAVGTYFVMACFSRHAGTAGRLSRAAALSLVEAPATLERLVATRLLAADGAGYRLSDWTPERCAMLRKLVSNEAARESGRRGGMASGETRRAKGTSKGRAKARIENHQENTLVEGDAKGMRRPSRTPCEGDAKGIETTPNSPEIPLASPVPPACAPPRAAVPALNETRRDLDLEISEKEKIAEERGHEGLTAACVTPSAPLPAPRVFEKAPHGGKSRDERVADWRAVREFLKPHAAMLGFSDLKDLGTWLATLLDGLALPCGAAPLPYVRAALPTVQDYVAAHPGAFPEKRISSLRRKVSWLVNDDKPRGYASGKTDGAEGVCALPKPRETTADGKPVAATPSTVDFEHELARMATTLPTPMKVVVPPEEIARQAEITRQVVAKNKRPDFFVVRPRSYLAATGTGG